jgi:Bacterial Ig-like domain (group 2)
VSVRFHHHHQTVKRLVPVALLLAGACVDSGTTPDPIELLRAAPTSLVLTPGDTGSVDLTGVTLSGRRVTPASVRWSSTDPGVVAVDADGRINAMARGTARVTATAGRASASISVVVDTVFNLNVNTQSTCDDAQYDQARVAAKTQHALVLADLGNPPGGLTDDEYRAFGQLFDDLAYPVDTYNFGEPTDIDHNGRIILFFTRAVNALTPPNQSYYVGGFFFARDLLPRRNDLGFVGCAGSNYAEMFYLLVPDPTGSINGNVRTKSLVDQVTTAAVAHEFQHLINTGRRLYVTHAVEQGGGWIEDTWLNEGLSHIAEELVFYQAAALQPRQDIGMTLLNQSPAYLDAYSRYMLGNTLRLNEYLLQPDATSPYGGVDDLATRGATWLFLRYAADRSGLPDVSVWQALVNTPLTGIANLQHVFGPDVLDWIRDWAIANYTDDDGITTDPRYSHPSWNVHSLLDAVDGGYPLPVRSLADRVTTELDLNPGGAGYLTFHVAPENRAQIVVGPPTPPAPQGECTPTVDVAPALEPGQILAPPPGQDRLLCLDGGTTGADFVLIPVNGSIDGGLAVDVTGYGVAASLPTAVAHGATSQNPGQQGLLPDPTFEPRLRALERRQLASHIPGAAVNIVPAAPATLNDLTITLIRIH